MSNSSLVNYVKISPNKNYGRNHKIDTVTIHCTAGHISVESLGNWFSKTSTQASSNYGIGDDGRIGMYVPEGDRSWCSSSPSNDNRAVTIEVSTDAGHPYACTDAAYKSLIRLLVDICKRNGIAELKWQANKALIGQVDKQNMTVHMWFKNKSCPGEYLYSRHGQIAAEVNAALKGQAYTPSSTPASNPSSGASLDQVAQEVIAGKWGNNPDRKAKLAAAGYDANAVQARVNQILGGGKTPTSTASAPAKKTVDTIAQEVIAGKWGNNPDRKAKLAAAGYDANAVQARVNQILGGGKTPTSTASAPAKKTVDTIAQEVIAGKWGNNPDRKAKLSAAGYDANAVQSRVNQLLGAKSSAGSSSSKKSIDTIAREVIAGKWGNGEDRKKRLAAAGYDYNTVQKRVNQLV